MKLEFDPVADAAYFEITSAEIETTKEIEPGIIADYDANGHLIIHDPQPVLASVNNWRSIVFLCPMLLA